VPFEIIPAGTHYDFIGRRRITAALSIGVLAVAALAIPVRGIRLGIDFAGGMEVQVKFEPQASVDEGALRSVVRKVPGIEDLNVVRYGEPQDNEFLIRFQTESEGGVAQAAETPAAEAPAEAAESGAGEGAATAEAGAEEPGEAPLPGSDRVTLLDQAFESAFGSHSIERVEFVGPRVGKELRNDGLAALAIASLLILVYIWVRFTLRFSPGAIVASVHDLLVTAGILVILGMEFDLTILAAMLAILGYSLNDTIIIYDRIRENMELRTAHDLPEVLNESVNQTLSRTILTSGTTAAAVLSLFFLGGEVIRPFAFTMLIGIVVGTYSSVFIAAPVLLWLETRYGSGASAPPGPRRPKPAKAGAKR
jgi:preprotein translocase subunit SecF